MDPQREQGEKCFFADVLHGLDRIQGEEATNQLILPYLIFVSHVGRVIWPGPIIY